MSRTEIIKITYFTGWCISKSKKKEEASIFVHKIVDNKIIELQNPICLSWGNGTTLPLSIYRLEDDGTLSYYYKNKFNTWSHSAPRWEIINF